MNKIIVSIILIFVSLTSTSMEIDKDIYPILTKAGKSLGKGKYSEVIVLLEPIVDKSDFAKILLSTALSMTDDINNKYKAIKVLERVPIGLYNRESKLYSLYNGASGLPADYNKAFKYLNFALENNQYVPKGKTRLASMYANGLGTKKDIIKAIGLYTEEINKGKTEYVTSLVNIYLQAENVEMAFNVYKQYGVSLLRYDSYHLAKKLQDAMPALASDEDIINLLKMTPAPLFENRPEIIMKAKEEYYINKWEKIPDEEKDSAAGQYVLGTIYLNGYGVDENLNKSEEHFLNAANLNHIESMYQLVLIYKQRNNKSDELRWLNKLKEKNHEQGMILLANRLEHENDLKQAISLYLKVLAGKNITRKDPDDMGLVSSGSINL